MNNVGPNWFHNTSTVQMHNNGCQFPSRPNGITSNGPQNDLKTLFMREKRRSSEK